MKEEEARKEDREKEAGSGGANEACAGAGAPVTKAAPEADAAPGSMGGHLSYGVGDALGRAGGGIAFGKGSVITDFFNDLYKASAGGMPVDVLEAAYPDRFCLEVSAALKRCLLSGGAEGFEKGAALRASAIRRAYRMIKARSGGPGADPGFWEAMAGEGGAIADECGRGFARDLVFAAFEAFERRFGGDRKGEAA